MSWMDQIGNILQRYGGSSGAASAPAGVHEHFDEIARSAPPAAVADGLAESFRSDKTPPFDQMLSNLFSHSDGQQKAGLLNNLLGSGGPGMLAMIPALAGLFKPGQQITAQQAEQVSPDTVQQMAAEAQQKNPSIIDQASAFYAQHPQVVKAMGGAALAILIQRMAQKNRG